MNLQWIKKGFRSATKNFFSNLKFVFQPDKIKLSPSMLFFTCYFALILAFFLKNMFAMPKNPPLFQTIFCGLHILCICFERQDFVQRNNIHTLDWLYMVSLSNSACVIFTFSCSSLLRPLPTPINLFYIQMFYYAIWKWNFSLNPFWSVGLTIVKIFKFSVF